MTARAWFIFLLVLATWTWDTSLGKFGCGALQQTFCKSHCYFKSPLEARQGDIFMPCSWNIIHPLKYYSAPLCGGGENRWNHRRWPFTSAWQLSEAFFRSTFNQLLAVLTEKKSNFWIILQTAVWVDLTSHPLRSITHIRDVNLGCFSIPNKVWQQCAAGCQNSPWRRGSGPLPKPWRWATMAPLFYLILSLTKTIICNTRLNPMSK